MFRYKGDKRRQGQRQRQRDNNVGGAIGRMGCLARPVKFVWNWV